MLMMKKSKPQLAAICYWRSLEWADSSSLRVVGLNGDSMLVSMRLSVSALHQLYTRATEAGNSGQGRGKWKVCCLF